MNFDRYLELCQAIHKSQSAVALDAGFSAASASAWKQGTRITPQSHLRLITYFRSKGLEVPDNYFADSDDELIDKTTELPETTKPPAQRGGHDILPSVMRPILGSIPCGPTQYEAEDIMGYAPTAEKNPEDTYWLIVHGDSMVNAGIRPNDRVLIRHQDFAEDGQIVAVLIEGQATLKRLRKDGPRIYLCPESDNYSRFELTTKDFDEGRAKIIGVALEVSHRL